MKNLAKKMFCCFGRGGNQGGIKLTASARKALHLIEKEVSKLFGSAKVEMFIVNTKEQIL